MGCFAATMFMTVFLDSVGAAAGKGVFVHHVRSPNRRGDLHHANGDAVASNVRCAKPHANPRAQSVRSCGLAFS